MDSKRADSWTWSRVSGVLIRVSRFIVESNVFRTLTGVLTLYALFGDDCRLSFTEKPADIVFDWLVCTCFVVFAAEVFLSCLGQDDYWGSFFFVLDLISTATLIMDVTAVQDYMYAEDSDDMQSARTSRAARIGTKAGRAVRILRLIRVIKLYKALFHMKKQKRPAADPDLGDWDEAEEVEDDEAAASSGQESQVSTQLSARMTQRTIILVLSMLVFLPLLKEEAFNPTAGHSGADEVLRTFRKLLANSTSEALRRTYEDALLRYVYLHGWYQSHAPSACTSTMYCASWYYSHAWWLGVASKDGAYLDAASRNASLRLATVEAFDASAAGGGVFGRLPAQAQALLAQPWVDTCNTGSYATVGLSLLSRAVAGYNDQLLRCPNDLRPQEKEKYSPLMLTEGEFENLHFAFYFDKRKFIKTSSNMNMVLTVFICIVLLVSSVMLSTDANVLILAPIDSIMQRLEALRKDPLASVKMADEEFKRDEIRALARAARAKRSLRARFRTFTGMQQEEQQETQTVTMKKEEMLETAVLEKTIIKLGTLLALGFGQAGSKIVSDSIGGASSAKVSVMNSGNRVSCVIGNVRLRDFSTANVVLQRSVTTFVNQVAEIVHGAVDEFLGSINRNNGEFFLVIWQNSLDSEEQEPTETSSERFLADASVMAFVRILGAVHSSPVLARYRQHPGLQQRLGSRCRVNISFGLHYGWAYQGALGSEYKIDAAYVSPHVSVTSHIESATRTYWVPLLLSQKVVELCSEDMVELLRQVDKVRVRGYHEPLELYSFDLDYASLEVAHEASFDVTWNRKQRYRMRKILEKDRELKLTSDTSFSSLLKSYAAHPFAREFYVMRKAYSEMFLGFFGMGFQNYLEGEWDVARQYLRATLNMLGFRDGPSSALLRLMDHLSSSSDRWQGFHKLDDFEDIT
eukprot:TRINITY_DN25229_c0_g2_i1.p1 TRINITY_DN25229_c0_g2~~TRINITY_DN25229_c0_g2_i1.p1  ORF type:complete len:917 (+),score=223.22 TRINITY_DN25229_c0_g2_i1:274-3024(+)